MHKEADKTLWHAPLDVSSKYAATS